MYIMNVPYKWHKIERRLIKLDKYTPEQARRLKGYSQAKMAELLGVSENTYINKEKGETKFYIDEACKFSDLVGIPLENIIFFKRDVPQKRNIIQKSRIGKRCEDGSDSDLGNRIIRDSFNVFSK